MFFTLAFLSFCLCCSFSLDCLFINKSEKLNSLCKNRIITSLLKIVNVMIFSRCCTCVHVICGWHSLEALHTLKSLYWWILFYHQVTQSSPSPFFVQFCYMLFCPRSFVYNILFIWCLHMHESYPPPSAWCFMLHLLLLLVRNRRRNGGPCSYANTTNRHRLVCMEEAEPSCYKLACGC